MRKLNRYYTFRHCLHFDLYATPNSFIWCQHVPMPFKYKSLRFWVFVVYRWMAHFFTVPKPFHVSCSLDVLKVGKTQKKVNLSFHATWWAMTKVARGSHHKPNERASCSSGNVISIGPIWLEGSNSIQHQHILHGARHKNMDYFNIKKTIQLIVLVDGYWLALREQKSG